MIRCEMRRPGFSAQKSKCLFFQRKQNSIAKVPCGGIQVRHIAGGPSANIEPQDDSLFLSAALERSAYASL